MAEFIAEIGQYSLCIVFAAIVVYGIWTVRSESPQKGKASDVPDRARSDYNDFDGDGGG